jgi:hypothetical protein
MTNTSETAERKALQAVHTAIDAYARLTGYLEDGFTITSFIIATAAESLDGHTETGAIPSHPMPRYMMHGLLDYVDSSILNGDFYTSDDDDDDDEDDDGNL